MAKAKLYKKKETILQKKITHTIQLDTVMNELVRRMKEGNFKLEIENTKKSSGSTSTLDLHLCIGRDPNLRVGGPIVRLTTDLSGDDIAKLLGTEEIVADCTSADVLCDDRDIVITKLVSEE